MYIKLVDSKSGRCVASADIKTKSEESLSEVEIEEILRAQKLFLDGFGNVKNIFGEFTKYHVNNLVPVREYISA
ncbi:MAG: hypothetical protein ILA15_09990 [Clostridiales bacterium]|nr:hypothetical protein [Clostridiales bacterium]